MADNQLTPAQKRARSKVIGQYLEALAAQSKPRGRRTREYLQGRLQAIAEALDNNNVGPLDRVHLIQEQLDVTHDLVGFAQADRLAELEKEFIAHAGRYSADKGVSRRAWREVGVPAKVLTEAGIQ